MYGSTFQCSLCELKVFFKLNSWINVCQHSRFCLQMTSLSRIGFVKLYILLGKTKLFPSAKAMLDQPYLFDKKH